jgi:hypothetical protein
VTPKTTIPPDGGEGLRKITQQIDQAFEAGAKLSGSNLPPTDFYQQFLSRVLSGTDAHAGAVWLKTPQGFLQIQTQIHLDKVGLDEKKGGRQTHNELLRRAFQSNRPLMLEPFGRLGTDEGPLAANLTEYLVMLAPILAEDGTALGLLEVWQEPYIDPRIHPTFMSYVVQMAGYASNYHKNSTVRRSTGQEQAWTQIENFARLVHSSLNPTEVAFHVANEGRRVIDCDRISVGVRHGRKVKIEAVTGNDVVEKASTHVKRMRKLFDRVIEWGEKLEYRGTRDETLPPRVGRALDDYLAEANPKFLVLLPLRDEREKTKEALHKKARSALLMECFETPERVEPLVQRLEVIAGHAAPALYNAARMKRIPLGLLWKPIAAIQDGVGGKARFWTFFVLAILTALTLAMIYVPYPLKLDAKGQLVPAERVYIYSYRPGTVDSFSVKPGDIVRAGTPIAVMRDHDLMELLTKLQNELIDSQGKIETERSQSTNQALPEAKRREASAELFAQQERHTAAEKQLNDLARIYQVKDRATGQFFVQAPSFPPSRSGNEMPRWTVLTADFQEQLTHKWVQPNTPLLHVGNKTGAWEIEQKIPQKHIGHLRQAFKTNDPNEFLDVDVLVVSQPTTTYKGRLYQRSIAGEAVPNRDDHNQSDPVLYAYVTVNEPDLPPIPEDLLVAGVEVKTKIRCGDRSMGYSLFHGVWEFFYENVLFLF